MSALARHEAMQVEVLAETLERAAQGLEAQVAGCSPTVRQVAALAADDATQLLQRVHSLRRRIECEVPADVA
jgi:hypothetical protein